MLSAMRQDDFLREKFGSANHFRVPENYFDDFAARLMGRIPQAEAGLESKVLRLATISKARKCLCVAAMACGAFIGIGVMRYSAGQAEKPAETAAFMTQDEYLDQYVEDVCDFAGISGEQIYACVTDAETDY